MNLKLPAYIQRLFIFLSTALFLSGCHYSRGSIVIDWSVLSFSLSTFGLMLGISVITANFILQKEFHRAKIDLILSDQSMIIALFLGFIGARTFFVLEMKGRWDGFDEMINIFQMGGLTFYGGFLAAAIGILLFWKKKRLPLLSTSDLAAPALSIGYGIGRLGCFFSGDGCYGTECTLNLSAPICMAFPDGVYPWSRIIEQYGRANVTVYNTPLMEAIFAFLIFAFFWKIRKKQWKPGLKMLTFIILYSTMRFFIEFIRRNPPDVFGMTQAQFISIILLTTSFTFLILYRVKNLNASKF